MTSETTNKVNSKHFKPKPRIKALFQYIILSLLLIAAVEYFKYSTRINYEWFHCTIVRDPIRDSMGEPSSVFKLSAVGGPSCDKRGELKTIMKRIVRDYEPNEENLSFCLIENESVKPIHYPLGEVKGEAGYWAYVGYDSDKELVKEMCNDATLYHL
ncbi:sphingosine N-acyltransferase subunit LIP1 KNAG_0E01360 [Huiozyma naganishii CBS 8797]|uniref:Ceramide synthase subunit LIP1 n=1 Tax=Huiozyma naganishii (strain ATCC MYA-139 / BCRC 22969 / CBS 8797 / KCTC 17520 / NBRC 10181 / NCYC 3082 / Yp74L-3) TaxID=1071383 RepID=J7RYY2_HUIN7|nr:hypothetical protein KNAG_0E01360 [Kazachstania naganishii CBS 8797]CCK70402.1 hypothetical protein KNAG_0E01360 [Kazachstania naganishii CBS 8797]